MPLPELRFVVRVSRRRRVVEPVIKGVVGEELAGGTAASVQTGGQTM